MNQIEIPSTEKFLSYIIDSSDVDKCWIWKGTLNGTGYGRFSDRLGRKMLAHRLAFWMFKLEHPGNKFVCHKCDTRKCVNPNHLFLGTAKENSEDMVSKGRQHKGEDHTLATISSASIANMRALFMAGAPVRSVAIGFGVRQSDVRRIARGITRRHDAPCFPDLPRERKFFVNYDHARNRK